MIGEPEHVDGISWDRRKVPPRSHQCWAATTVGLAIGIMQRCPCGAARFLIPVSGKPLTTPRWAGKNVRRTDTADREYRRPAWVSLAKRLTRRLPSL